jgi:hypothetical protein
MADMRGSYPKILKEDLRPSKTRESKAYEEWWNANEVDAADHMVSLIHALNENQKSRKWQNIRHSYLYTNRQGNDIVTDNFARPLSALDRYNVTYNVVSSAIDTVTAKIAQKEIRPRVLTERGDYTKQRRAKKLTKYLDGVMAADHLYRKGPECLRDAGVFGTGVLKVIPDPVAGCIRTERVVINEILVDEPEAMHGSPRSMYQIRRVAKSALMAQFPERAKEIAALTPDGSHPNRLMTEELVRLYEGWHLGSDAEKGRHILATEAFSLVDEEWKHPVFPFAFLYYKKSIASFYGIGIAEELIGTQLEINKLLRDIQRAQNLVAVPRVLVEYNSKVVTAHLNNDIGSAIKYQGTRPDFISPTAMSNEIYNHVKWLISSAFEKVGISQLSAASKKPAGLDSGRAIREFKDTETERFWTTEKNYQSFFEDVADLTIRFSRDLYEEVPELQVKTEDGKFIESIKWEDVDLDHDKFVTRVHVSSLFPTSPAAKLQKVEEYIRAGWMDRESALRLLDFPDTEAWETLETSDRNYIERIISDILEDGAYRAPEPEMLLEKDINIARKAYLDALNKNVESDKVELLLRWIEAASSLLPAVAPAAPVAPEAAPLQAEPLPLPESGMLPQVPGVGGGLPQV